MHPMAVVELLWRSCCASESEKEQNSLTARLKVRQRTQLLVDHSLLLGSSLEGIHLHDIVLTYLRKRLSSEELRTLHLRVVDEMFSVAATRLEGLQDTGTSDKVRSRRCLTVWLTHCALETQPLAVCGRRDRLVLLLPRRGPR